MRRNKDVACSTYSANFSLIWSTVSLPPPAPPCFLPSGTHFHFICNANGFAPLQSCIMHNYSLHTSNRSGSSTSDRSAPGRRSCDMHMDFVLLHWWSAHLFGVHLLFIASLILLPSYQSMCTLFERYVDALPTHFVLH